MSKVYAWTGGALIALTSGFALLPAASALTNRAGAATAVTARTAPGLDAMVLAQPASGSPASPTGPSDGGLLLDRGVLRPLPDVPGALSTVHFRNNDRGQIVGTYADGPAAATHLHGFLMRGGHVTTLDVPGAAQTSALGINDRGRVVGTWFGPDAKANPVTGELSPGHGFIWQRGRFTTIDVPGAAETAAYEINNRGQVVGNYVGRSGAQHGFILHAGVVTTIDHPNASRAPNTTGTRVAGINDRGQLVGSYGDDTGTIRAYLWSNGQFTDIAPPGALASEAEEIDNTGRIAGRYLDPAPKLVSFLLDRSHLTPIDVAGRCDTAAVGLNDLGQVVIAAPGTTDGSTCPQQAGAS